AVARGATGGLAPSGTGFNTVLLPLIALLAAIHHVVSADAFRHELNARRVAVLLTGLQFMVVGNVMGKVRPNHWLGIRTPWTLADDRVWDRTHRFGGWLFVICGALLAIVAVLVPGGKILTAILLTAIAIVVLALF